VRSAATPEVNVSNGKPADTAAQLPPVAPAPVPVEQQSHMAVDEITGANLLLADLRTVVMLANDVRYRTLERLFGLPRAQANVATLVAIVAVAEAARAKLGRLAWAPAPSAGDLALGTATVRHLMLGPAADSAPTIPMFGALAAIAAGGTVVIPAAVRSVRGARSAAREVGSFFGRRYRQRAAR
jgi:hypothetical protein